MKSSFLYKIYKYSSVLQINCYFCSTKDISKYNPGEGEVLYPRDSVLSVIEIEERDGTINIYTEETNNE